MFNEPIQQKDNIWAVYQVVEWEDEILGYFQLMYKTINTEEIFPYSHLNKGLTMWIINYIQVMIFHLI